MIVIGKLYADESEEVVWFEQKKTGKEKTNSTVACNIYSIYSFCSAQDIRRGYF
jgi:hypothetical protein